MVRVLHKNLDVIDVAEFGAYGNGIDDDTAGLQNALEHANSNNLTEIFLRPGIYKITSPTVGSALTLANGNGVRLRGAYWGGVEIRLTNTAGTALTIANSSNIKIENIAITCSADTPTTHNVGISLRSCKETTIEDCLFTGFGQSAIQVLDTSNPGDLITKGTSESENIKIIKNRVKDCYGVAAIDLKAKHVITEKNTISETAAGIRAKDCFDYESSNDRIFGCNGNRNSSNTCHAMIIDSTDLYDITGLKIWSAAAQTESVGVAVLGASTNGSIQTNMNNITTNNGSSSGVLLRNGGSQLLNTTITGTVVTAADVGISLDCSTTPIKGLTVTGSTFSNNVYNVNSFGPAFAQDVAVSGCSLISGQHAVNGYFNNANISANTGSGQVSAINWGSSINCTATNNTFAVSGDEISSSTFVNPLQVGNHYIWVDETGSARVSGTWPSSTTDGNLI